MEKQNMPMDVTMPEGAAEMHVNHPRNVYAMDQLISEVEALFPDVHYEVSDRNPRNVAFSVRFDLIGDMDLRSLLTLVESDERVSEVVADREGVMVTFITNPVLMDNRDTFDLEAAYAVFAEGSL